MASYHGSVMNFPFSRRIVLWFFVYILPVIAIVTTVGMAPYVHWWPFLLIPTLIIWMIALSFSGMVLRGHQIDFLDGEISYRRGWSKGRIPFRNLLKVYRVFYRENDSVMIIFNEPSSKNNPNRCLSIEQIFRKNDRKSIFREIKEIGRNTDLDIVDRATIEDIRSDKKFLKWVPV
jgi:hypothetical protein